MNSNSKYKEYWEKTAQKQKEEGRTFTHSDKYIPILEREEISRHLDVNDKVLEIGCGACDNSIFYMPKVKEYMGVELIQTFVELSRERIESGSMHNASIVNDDGLEYIKNNKLNFDKLITQRFIINLATPEMQLDFFRYIHQNAQNRDAKIIVCEGFMEELNNLNLMRRKIGLANIPVAEYNNFLTLEMIEKIENIGFSVESIKGFDTYLYATRLFNNEQFAANFDEMQKAAYTLEKANLSQISPSVSYVKIYVFSIKD